MSETDRIMLPFDEGLISLPEDGSILFIRPNELPRQLANDPRIICEQGFKPVGDILEASGASVTPSASGSYAMVMLALTRSRVENMANFARACQMVQSGGTIVVSGQKTDGIESMLKSVKKICAVDGVISKSHGKVFWASIDSLPAELDEWRQAAQATKNKAGFLTAPGMFSPNKIDQGSILLTEHFDKSIKGPVADLGSGWGYLGVKLLDACENITRLDMFEAEHIALEAARANVTDPRASFHWADASKLSKPAEPYFTVISNPPFHQGRAAEPAIGVSFIAAAARILRPSGQLLMVANRQLPYESALDLNFKHWSILHQDKSFKVIRAQRPISQR